VATDVVIPTDLWDEDSEAAITAWLVSDGAQVAKGQLVAESMVEKVQHEVLAPADGTIAIVRQADEVAAKGETIARIG